MTSQLHIEAQFMDYQQGWGQLQIGDYNYGINCRPNIIINYNYNYTVTAQVQLQLHQGGFQLCN